MTTKENNDVIVNNFGAGESNTGTYNFMRSYIIPTYMNKYSLFLL